MSRRIDVMDKKLDVYQKISISTALLGLIFIIVGFIISKPTIINIQKSISIQPNVVHKVNEQTKEYIFEFNSTQQQTLCFVSDLEEIYVYQNENLIYSIDEGQSIIGKTPGKVFNFIEIPLNQCKITVVCQNQYMDPSLSFTIGSRNFAIKEALVQSLPYVLVYFIIFLEGVTLFLYWAVVRKELTHSNVGLYLSLLLLVSGLWFIRGSDFVSILIRDYFVTYFIGYILFLQIPFLLFAFLTYYWQVPCKSWIKNTYTMVSSLNMLICILLQVLGIKNFRETVFITHILLIISFIYAFYGMYQYWKVKGIDYKITLTFIPLLITMISTTGNYFGFYNKKIMSSYKTGGIAILLLVIFVSIVTFYELSLQLNEGRKNEIYKKIAVTDLLTGLNNRNAYENWEQEHKYDFNDVSIILCDLNNLKFYNDNYGHEQGDKYIIAASEILSKSIEGKGVCYRIGGDEFIIICKNTTYEIIKEILNNIESMQHEFNRSSEFLTMEIAYGYATAKENDNSVTDIVKRADVEMYVHKKHIKESAKF